MSARPTSLTPDFHKTKLQGADFFTLELEMKKAVFANNIPLAQAVIDLSKETYNGFYAITHCLEDAASLGRVKILEAIKGSFKEERLQGYNQLHAAFQRAVIHGEYEAAQTLFQMGAVAYDVGPSHGQQSPSAMYRAIKRDDRKAIRFLLDHLEDDNRQTVLDSALSSAIVEKNIGLVRFFKDEGANVNSGHENSTPLNYACIYSDADGAILDLLLSWDAKPDNQYGYEISEAVSRNNISAVEKLVTHGAEIKKFSVRLLTDALYSKRLDMAEKLIELGADINAVTGDFSTLSWALQQKNKDAVDFCIRHNAPVPQAVALLRSKIGKESYMGGITQRQFDEMIAFLPASAKPNPAVPKL